MLWQNNFKIKECHYSSSQIFHMAPPNLTSSESWKVLVFKYYVSNKKDRNTLGTTVELKLQSKSKLL